MCGIKFRIQVGKNIGSYECPGGEGTLADAIMDRISYDSYKINIVGIDPSKDISMRELYGLDPAEAQ